MTHLSNVYRNNIGNKWVYIGAQVCNIVFWVLYCMYIQTSFLKRISVACKVCCFLLSKNLDFSIRWICIFPSLRHC